MSNTSNVSALSPAATLADYTTHPCERDYMRKPVCLHACGLADDLSAALDLGECFTKSRYRQPDNAPRGHLGRLLASLEAAHGELDLRHELVTLTAWNFTFVFMLTFDTATRMVVGFKLAETADLEKSPEPCWGDCSDLWADEIRKNAMGIVAFEQRDGVVASSSEAAAGFLEGVIDQVIYWYHRRPTGAFIGRTPNQRQADARRDKRDRLKAS